MAAHMETRDDSDNVQQVQRARRIGLSDEQIRLMLQRNASIPANIRQIRVAFLPSSDVDDTQLSFMNRISKKIVGHFTGSIIHAELEFQRETVGPISFTGYEGTFDDDYENNWFFVKMWDTMKDVAGYHREGAQVCLLPKLFRNPGYRYLSFDICAATERKLLEVCADLHGANFNFSGKYRRAFGKMFAKTTRRTELFCSESIVLALQLSGAMDEITVEENKWLCTCNPGSILPEELYEALSVNGQETTNQNFVKLNPTIKRRRRRVDRVHDIV